MSSSFSKTLPSVTIAMAAIAIAISAPAVRAQQVAQSADSESSLQEVIVTGTRQQGVVAADSAAPIQIIGGDALAATGQSTMIGALAELIPSFQVQAFGTDMSNQTVQARLRGLSPNHVLVLVDGKRRHTTANLDIAGGIPSPYQGGAGVDLNFIPMSAVDHIEVLTEGAAAQYGSDAIAGVINIILKKNSSGGTIDATTGGFFDGGGRTAKVEGEMGFQPIENSFFNVTAQFYNHGRTDRGNLDPRTDPAYFTGNYPNSNIPNAPNYPDVNHIQGDADTVMKLVGFNTGFHLPGDVEIYANGTYGDKTASSYENYRVPNKVSCLAGDPCFALGNVATYPFPLGFNPQEQSREQDYQLVGGVKGAIEGWNWDLSEAYGKDRVAVYTIGSANASIYADTGTTPTDFYDGKFVATQATSNIDINKDFDVGLAGPLTVAFGGEYRLESWLLGPGAASSYFGGGAQSFPGYSSIVATNANRHSEAGYLDLATKPIDGLRVDIAGRYEDYSDFGSATVGKFTTRYDFNPMIAVRGTISTGFRAPTLAEEHYTNVNVSPTSAIVQLAPDGPGTALLGLGGGLKPERSTSFSFGTVLRPLPNLTATVDAYQIQVTNRIVSSGQINGQNGNLTGPATPFPGAENVTAAIAASGLSIDPLVLAEGTTGISIFANGIDTVTRGIDFTLTSPQNFSFGRIDFSIAGSYNYTVATHVLAGPAELGGQPLFDAAAVSALTDQSPRLTLNLGAHYSVDEFYVDLHEIIYGKSSGCDDPDGDTSTAPLGKACANEGGGLYYYEDHIGSIAVTNLELGVNLRDSVTFAIGANNLFNRYPNQVNGNNTAIEKANFDNAAVEKYLPFSPIGIDGGFYYARLGYKF